jgi:hypothetical protein
MQRPAHSQWISNAKRLARLAPLAGIIACSSLDPRTDTWAGELDAGNGGESGKPLTPPEWKCLDQPQVPVARNPEPVAYVVAIVDFDRQLNALEPIEGLDIVVCGSATCEEPEEVMITGVPDRPPYLYRIVFSYGFDNAVLRLTAPGYVPMDYILGGRMIGPPEGGSTVLGRAIPLLREATLANLYKQLGFTEGPDPERGVLAVRTLNCLRDPMNQDISRAAGVQLAMVSDTLDPGTVWSLSFNNIATRSNETDERGVVGYLNAPPQAFLVEAVATVGGNEVRYGRNAVQVRPGVITLAELRDGVGRWGQ